MRHPFLLLGGGRFTAPLNTEVDMLRSATVTLTDAQIKALPTTPITLVAAPGAGLIVFPLSVALVQQCAGGAAYTNVDPDGYFEFHLGGNQVLDTIPNDSGSGLTQLDGLTGASDTLWMIHQAHEGGNAAAFAAWDSFPFTINLSGLANAALTADIDNNGMGDLTGGDPANTWKITVYYVLVSV